MTSASTASGAASSRRTAAASVSSGSPAPVSRSCCGRWKLRQFPVDRLSAPLFQQPAGTAEWPRAEESTVRRVRARVSRLDAPHAIEQRREAAGVPAPQDGGERSAPGGERPYCLLGDLFPALPAMR